MVNVQVLTNNSLPLLTPSWIWWWWGERGNMMIFWWFVVTHRALGNIRLSDTPLSSSSPTALRLRLRHSIKVLIVAVISEQGGGDRADNVEGARLLVTLGNAGYLTQCSLELQWPMFDKLHVCDTSEDPRYCHYHGLLFVRVPTKISSNVSLQFSKLNIRVQFPQENRHNSHNFKKYLIFSTKTRRRSI